MTDADRPKFAELLAFLAVVFTEQVPRERAEAYFVLLADLPIEAVMRAVELAGRDRTWFPKPVELRELASFGRVRLLEERQRDEAMAAAIQQNEAIMAQRRREQQEPAAVARRSSGPTRLGDTLLRLLPGGPK